MDNPQELKKAILASLAEKGDFNTILSHLSGEEKVEKEEKDRTKLTKLIEPLSELADLMTQNTKGVFIENMDKKMAKSTQEGLSNLATQVNGAIDSLEEELRKTIDTTKSELTAEHLEKLNEAKSELEEKMLKLALDTVVAKSDELLPSLKESGKLTPDEVSTIIDSAALSVESQVSGIIAEYIEEHPVTTKQIKDFTKEVQKLIPQVDFSNISIDASQVRNMSQGGTSAALVNTLIATALANFTGGASTLNELTDVDVPSPNNSEVLTYNSSTSKWESVPPPGASGGEANTITNLGSGVGVYKNKVGVDLKLKSLNAGSTKVTITDDTGNDEIDIGVDESNFELDNMVSDTTNKVYTATEQTKVGHISVTQAVNLDTIESDTATNNSKTTNATHTGEVRGSGALTVDKTAISNKTDTVITASDVILFGDATDTDALKKDTVQGILDLVTGGGHTVEDEGISLTQRTKLNFVGAGVTVTDDSGDDATVVTIPTSGGTTNNFNTEVIEQTGGTSDTYGVLGGLVNGSNTLYTVSGAVYITATLTVYLDGQLQTQGSSEDWVETTPASGTFTFAVAPPTGAEVTAIFQTQVLSSDTVLTSATFSAKGDVLSASADDTLAILAVGTNGQVLSADSAETSGLKWIAAAGGGDALVANPLSQFAATTSAQLAGVLSDETGSGVAVFATSPTLITPALGTPSALVATNATGTASGLTVGATTGVEAGADVTDTANVTTAGALMDSEVDADLKTFVLPASTTISTFGATIVDDTSANAVLNTLGVKFIKGITIESPTSSEDITMFFTDDAITVTQLNAVLANGTSTPSVTYKIFHHTDRSNAGNAVVTAGSTTTSVSTGDEVTSFNDATIPAGSWVWLETTAQSGSVPELNVVIEFTRD